MCQTSFAVILDQLAEIKTSLHDLRRHVDHRFDSLSQVIPEKLSSAIEQSETRVASRVQKLLGSTRKSSDRLAGERHGEVIDRLAQVNDNFSRWLSNVRLKDGTSCLDSVASRLYNDQVYRRMHSQLSGVRICAQGGCLYPTVYCGRYERELQTE